MDTLISRLVPLPPRPQLKRRTAEPPPPSSSSQGPSVSFEAVLRAGPPPVGGAGSVRRPRNVVDTDEHDGAGRVDDEDDVVDIRAGGWLGAALAAYAGPTETGGVRQQPTRAAGSKRLRFVSRAGAPSAAQAAAAPMLPAVPMRLRLTITAPTQPVMSERPAVGASVRDAAAAHGGGAFDVADDDAADDDMGGTAAAGGRTLMTAPGDGFGGGRAAASVEAAVRAGAPPPLGTLDEEVAAVRSAMLHEDAERQRGAGGAAGARSSADGALPARPAAPPCRRWGEALPTVPTDGAPAVARSAPSATTAVPAPRRGPATPAGAIAWSPEAAVGGADAASVRAAAPLPPWLARAHPFLADAAVSASSPALAVTARLLRLPDTPPVAFCVDVDGAGAGGVRPTAGPRTRVVGAGATASPAAPRPAPALAPPPPPPPPSDLFMQALFAVPDGRADDILRQDAVQDAPPMLAGDGAGAVGATHAAAAVAAAAARAGGRALFPHAQPAVALAFAPTAYTAEALGVPPPPGDDGVGGGARRSTLALAPAGTLLAVRRPVAVDGGGEAAGARGADSLWSSATATRNGDGTVAGGASTAVSGPVRVSSGSAQLRRRSELSAQGGDVLLFEFSEAHPPIRLRKGMAARLVTYTRTAAALSAYASAADDDADDAEGGAGGGAGTRAAGGIVTDEGVVEVVRSPDGYPLLGGLDTGERVTALLTPLFAAPVFVHDARLTDFLLVLRRGGGGVTAVLREIKKLYVVGQEEPRAEVLRPSARGKGGVIVPDAAAAEVRRALTCYQLLVWMRDEDDAARAAVVAAAATSRRAPGAAARTGATGAGATAAAAAAVAAERDRGPGMVLLRTALERFGRSAAQAAAFLESVADVATYDDVTGVLRRRADAPTPEALREARRLTPERVVLLEALLAGEAALRAAGLAVLQLDDRPLEDALTKLQELYDRMVQRLKASGGQGAVPGGGPTGGGSGDALWQHDGGYRRMRRTLEIAQAVYYLLQTTPWATSHNYLSYTRRGDTGMLALTDASGAGDPSGRGEAFSFIRDVGQRRIAAALAAAAAATTGGLPARREGTDRDARALTNVQMAEMLTAMGMRPEVVRRMGRWERVRAIRDKQNEQLSLARSGGGGDGAPLLFAGEIMRLSHEDRRRLKAEQAKEVGRRQIDALSAAAPPGDGADGDATDDDDSDGDDSDGGDEFAEELERAMEANIRRAGTARRAADAAARAAQDERAEFDLFLKSAAAAAMRGGPTGAAAGSAGTGPGGGTTDSAPSGGGGGGGVTWAVAGAGAGGGGGSAIVARRFPLPLALLRPPHAPLLASTWAGSADAPAAASGAGRSGGAAATAAAAAASTTTQRAGARNPTDLSVLHEPPRAPVFKTLAASGAPDDAAAAASAATDVDAAAGRYSAAGKILRIVRSTVAADGRQVVRVTYSTNDFALQQVWLKHALGVDLGVLGVRSTRSLPAASAAGGAAPADAAPAVDPTGKGLVETGLYAPPRGPSGYTGRFRSAAEREREVERVFTRYTELSRRGFVLDGSRRDRHERKTRRVIIHGTGVPVCELCRLWGHRTRGGPATAGAGASGSSMCPFTAVSRARTGTHEVNDEQFARMRAAAAGGGWLGGGGSGVVAAVAGAERAGASEAVAAGGTAGARAGSGATSAASAASMAAAPTTRLRDRIVPAARAFARLLEAFLVDLMFRDETFAAFRAPVDAAALPSYSRIVAQPMDLGTMRRAAIARRYRYVEDVDADLRRIAAASETFNGPAHGLTKRARELARRGEAWFREHAKELRRVQEAMPRELATQVAALDVRRRQAAAAAAVGTGAGAALHVAEPAAADASSATHRTPGGAPGTSESAGAAEPSAASPITRAPRAPAGAGVHVAPLLPSATPQPLAQPAELDDVGDEDVVLEEGVL